MNILLIGDVYSNQGRLMIEHHLPNLINKYNLNLIIANGENIAHGNGITKVYYDFLLKHHVNVVTMGNHTFGNADIYNFIDDAKCLVRPINLPAGNPGRGYVTINYNGVLITVYQALGRTFMAQSIDDPFTATDKFLKEVKSDIYICDFHGEATSEKVAYGLDFDGKVQIIVGTHTHVQTNDAHILPNGSLYMSDLGMTGSLDGVIGVDKDIIIKKFRTSLPAHNKPMEQGRRQFCGLLVDLDLKTKKVVDYKIIQIIE